MRLIRIGQTILNLDLMTDASIEADGRLRLYFVSNGDGGNSRSFGDAEKEKLFAYLDSLAQIRQEATNAPA